MRIGITALALLGLAACEYSQFGSISRLKGHTKLFISPVGRAAKFDQPVDETFAKLSPVLASTRKEVLHGHRSILSLNKRAL